MREKLSKLVLLLIISVIYTDLKGEPVTKGEFAVFPTYTGNVVFDEVMSWSEKGVYETLNKAGRLVPFEYNYRRMAFDKSEGSDRENFYRNAAQRLNADIYAVLTIGSENGEYFLTVKLIPLNDRYVDLKREFKVRSRIPANIPLKAERELALLLKNTPLKSEVVKVFDDGTAMIDSGQWHGLENGTYETDAGVITVLNVSRYSAVVRGAELKPGKLLKLEQYPDLGRYLKKIDFELSENTTRFFGTDERLDKRDGSVKESIQGTCVINQGASFCLPGYGSYMSMEYMGIENGKPDYSAIFITVSLTAVQLGLVPYLTDYKATFLPWKDDRERSVQEERLNWFLLGTLPLTFTASFYSQLTYNYREKNLLPPMFADHDFSAGVVSVFVPGGGLFYKGYRWSAWGVYIGEMSMAGYAVYTEDKRERNILAGSLLLFKCIEVAASYFLPPSYSYFQKEVSSGGDVDFSTGFSSSKDRGEEFTASLVLRY